MIIYKTINLINGKIYVGRDKKNNPKYIGSGVLLWKAIKKYGIENFCKEILDYATSIDELNEKEIFWIKELNSQNPKIGYNIQKGGQGGDWDNLPNETKEWIKLRVSQTHKGRKHTPAVLLKMQNSMIGKNTGERSKEVKEKMSQNRKGKGLSRAPWHKGKTGIFSESTLNRLKENSAGEKNPMYGKKHTEETKQKIRKAAQGRKSGNKGIFKKYIFMKKDEAIHIANGQQSAILYCKENNLPYSILVKKLKSWNEYKIKIENE